MTREGKFFFFVRTRSSEKRTEPLQSWLHTRTFQDFSGGLTGSWEERQGERGAQQGSIRSAAQTHEKHALPGSRSSSGADGRMKGGEGCRGRVR